MVRLLAIVTCAVVLAGCPGKRHTLGLPVPQNGDPEARSRFLEAQAQFRRDGQGAEDFAAIAEDFPDDPIAPYAQLYAGMALVIDKDYRGAEKALAEVVDQGDEADRALVGKASLYLGIARNYLGAHAQARPLLARGEAAVDKDDARENGEFLAAMAVATAAGDSPLAAVPYFDRWYVVATPAERGYIVARVGELAAAAAPEAVRDAVARVEGKGPGRAILGYRLAADRDAAGDPAGAKAAREAAAPARKAVGLPLAATATGASPGGGEPGLFGAILPQGGKAARVGELATQGLAVAATAGAVTIDLRAAATADEAAAALDELAAAGVMAVIGPIDGESVDAAAVRANQLHVPMLSLSPTPERRAGGAYVYHLVHSAEARARILARRAIAGGVTTFAMLSPESGYGRAVSAAFADEVGKLGGTVVDQATYPDDTKSFASIAKKIGHKWQGVFVADQADKLELVAPALAAAGQMARPLGAKSAVGGRAIVLLSTAEGLSPDYLVDAGRHSEGALLAPGFYPDDKDPTIADFVKAYTAAVGKPPAMIDAYAFDAARTLTAIGAAGRSDLAGKLATAGASGVTGAVRFDADHRRADDGVVYTVVAVGTGPDQIFEIHAQR